MKKIILEFDDAKLSMKMEGEITFYEAQISLLTALQSVYDQTIKNLPPLAEDKIKELKGDIYDDLNIAFSNILDHIIPTEDIPDLTSQAILEAENKIIEEASANGQTLEEYIKSVS